MDGTKTLLILIPALPLLAAILTALLGPRWLRGASHWPAVLAVLASFLLSVALARDVACGGADQTMSGEQRVGYEEIHSLWNWVSVPDAYQQMPTPPALDGGMGSWGLHDFSIDITLRADTLTAAMLCMVTFVSLLVIIFAAGYMHGDRGYWRFFTYVSLFVFSMVMLVSVSNLLLLYVFWEAVGVCSYLLIGFWYEKRSAAAAGKKAFLVNRVGDFGFAIALFLIWTTYGTLNFHDTPLPAKTSAATTTAISKPSQLSGSRSARVAHVAATPTAQSEEGQGILGQRRLRENNFVGGTLGTVICLLLLVGACGKSAQFPLHVWLPDAMEGPTPVSALIHAATMVTAGVYMTVRFAPFFLHSPVALLVVAVIGGFTALLAALIALTQTDLKRVLAYSTISQLGYMFLAVGTGSLAGITAGMFHLFTHAFFKALLFLGAGSVMHAMGGVIDMRRFGGLRKLMPVTICTFWIGCLALSGIPPLAGFWSKDAILGAVHEKIHALEHHGHDEGGHDDGGHQPHAAGMPAVVLTASSSSSLTASASGPVDFAFVYRILYISALVTALLTAFYTGRALFMTFYGPLEVPHEAAGHAHESPMAMCLPLIGLAVGAALLGMMLDWSWKSGIETNYFADFIMSTPSLAHDAARATSLPGVFHFDIAVWSSAIAALGLAISAFLYLGHHRDVDRLSAVTSRLGLYQLSQRKFFIDEIYAILIVWPLRGLAVASYLIDRWVVDGLVNGIARIPLAFGAVVRSLQMGLLSFYALAMVLGLLVLVAARMIWAGG